MIRNRKKYISLNLPVTSVDSVVLPPYQQLFSCYTLSGLQLIYIYLPLYSCNNT